MQGQWQTAKRLSRNVTRWADISDRGISRRQNHQNVVNLKKTLFILIALKSRQLPDNGSKTFVCLQYNNQWSIVLDARMTTLTWKNHDYLSFSLSFLESKHSVVYNHVNKCLFYKRFMQFWVLLKSLWISTCAVNRTLHYFHLSSTLQSRPLLYKTSAETTYYLCAKAVLWFTRSDDLGARLGLFGQVITVVTASSGHVHMVKHFKTSILNSKSSTLHTQWTMMILILKPLNSILVQ